jgi:hypothetical protein
MIPGRLMSAWNHILKKTSMAEEKFSPEQSLQLIQSMISKTKQDMSDNSIYFIVWGWITFIAFIAQFFLKHIYEYEHHYLVWMLTFVGVFFTIYQSRKEQKARKAKTYIGDSIKFLWAGLAISFFVLSIILTKVGWGTEIYPFFILLYGLGTFVSGKIIQFTPLVAGGIIAWGLAIASLWVSYDYQMLCGAAAILFSYILPAYLLRAKNKAGNN